MDYLAIGSSPCAEDCAQVGTTNYYELAMKECRIYINQLRRVYGNEPEGARLKIKANPHDFGTYYEVVCEYDDEENTKAMGYAFATEYGCENWDEIAKRELGLN